MRIFSLVCSLILLIIGIISWQGWDAMGWPPADWAAPLPVFVGGAMMTGTLLSFLLRRTGLQIAFLSALCGIGLAIGRMLPSWLKEAFNPSDLDNQFLISMAGLCTVYVLLSAIRFIFRPRPIQNAGVEPPIQADED